MTDDAPPGRAPSVAESRVVAWIDRAFSLVALATGIAAVGLAWQQLPRLRWEWLLVITGALVASSLLMPVYAWSSRGIRVPATMYAASVSIGLLSWPLAWQGGTATVPPWLWPCIGVSAVVLSIAWGDTVLRGTVVAIVHNVVCAAAYVLVRVTPSGGGVGAITAFQDTLVVAVQPGLAIVLFAHVRLMAARLDALVAEGRRQEADAALRASLVQHRHRLDAIIHDEVMTTLVAAARGPGGPGRPVADLARSAIASLEAQAGPDEEAGSFPPANVLRLLRDVVTTVSPDAAVVDQVDPMAPLVPHEVVRSLARATREAVLNAERHAGADRITATIRIQDREGGVAARVEVADDGVGFDASGVSPLRLGIRLSMQERMRAIGGRGDVWSQPGRGTRVVLEWTGSAEGAEGGPRHAHTGLLRDNPVLARLDLRPLRYVSVAAVLLFSLVGLLELAHTQHPWVIWSSLALVAVATPLVLLPVGRPLATWRAFAATACALTVCLLNAWTLPPAWNHATWFIGTVCMLTVLVRTRSHPLVAWVLAVGAAAILLAGAGVAGVPALLGPALSPLGWLLLVEMFVAWLWRIQADLDRAERIADEASAASAAAFGRLVVRDVWLADLREQVEGILTTLADPDATITEADREACLALEGRLRDDIRAANLTAPALSAAIMDARLRGVDVSLVDNRGEELSDVVRRAALRQLERAVRGATNGRIVARTAPVGYDAAVTIVQVDDHGSTLTTIGNDGMIAVNKA